jgi:DNA repair exonuclease SbcCD ATPase subunit
VIRRLHIEGWRAFEDLKLELDDGVTFIVAENGVGKTSLVQAAAWGLFGALSEVDARAACRFGTSPARVSVDLELPDGRELTIVRQVQDRSESMQARVGTRSLTDAEVASVMADSFGATREFLSKTTMLPSDAVADDATSAFQLREHLCRVFGVDDLQAAADALDHLRGGADAAAKAVRQQTRRAAADIAAVRGELAEAEAAQQAAELARADARGAVDAAEEQLRQALSERSSRAKADEARKAFAEVLTSARQIVGEAVALDDADGPATLTAHLEALETAAVEALDEHRRTAATIAGQLAAVRSAASELHAAGAECPVCRRELSAGDVEHAERAHEQETATLGARENEVAALVERASARVSDLRAVARRATKLEGIPPAPVEPAVDVDAVSLALNQARENAEHLIERAVEARTQRDALSTQIADEEQATRELDAAYLAHRREAVTSVAAEVMRASADAILTERIDPLAAEIGHRWKRVFGERGRLRLHHDGHLVLVRGIHEVPFSQFSSGEKVVALLATRLLILSASTRASFLWLDEPLEHLDPKNRRLIASLMTTAGKQVRQILVTTYEETLARRLAGSTHAQLRYVRTSDTD